MALLVQHGAIRNAKAYLCSFESLLRKQRYRDFRDILIVAPRFNYEHNSLVHPNDVFWNATKPWGDWRVGAESDPKCCGNLQGGRSSSTGSYYSNPNRWTMDVTTTRRAMEAIYSAVGDIFGGDLTININ